MNVNKSHKKSPPSGRRALKPNPSKPIERVSTKELIASIKRDIDKAIQESESAEKSKEK